MAEQVSVIIPAHNEADIIAETIGAALSIPSVTQVIVVDDGSTDGTADVARSAGAHRVIRLDRKHGKGGALNAAWPLAGGEILLLLDADLGSSARDGERLVALVASDESDMCIAVFGRSDSEETTSESGSVRLAAKSGGFGFVMRVARYGIRRLTAKEMESPLAGPRAFKTEIIRKIGGFAPRFGVEVGLTVDTLRLGYRVVEIPVGMVHRPSGRDFRGVLHRAGQLVDVLTTLLQRAAKR